MQTFLLVLLFILQGLSQSFHHQGDYQTKSLTYKSFQGDISKRYDSHKNTSIDREREGQYFGAQNIFLQPEQTYILVPALLFGTESSFKKIYQLEIVQNESKTQPDIQQAKAFNEPSLFQIYPALQKLNTYNLTAVEGLNVTDCAILEVFFEDDDTPYIMCLRKSRQLQVHRIDISEIHFEFSYRVSYLWNNMNIISTTEIFFYNASNMQFCTYNTETNILTVREYKIDENQSIKECETYIEDNPSIVESIHSQQINQQHQYQICYTNNNQVSTSKYQTINLKLDQIKKEYVIMFLIDLSSIKQLTSFEIPQKNSSSFNHIVGFDIIDSLEKVIMMCYNLYKLSTAEELYLQETHFVSSYCSIFKIYLDNNQMVLINRMQLQNTTFPLLQTSLQINVMLAVATQASVTFYQLDVLKERFEFIQQIYVPEKQNFNCYELSQLSNSYSSVSLTCAKDQDESKTVSFVMIFDEDLGKYVPVGDVIVGVDFFHSAQLIFMLNQRELIVLRANQQYAIFDYSEDKIEVRVYEVDIEKPQQKQRYASIIVNPAQYSGVYVDQVLPLIDEINYDESFQLNLRGAFQGSNISYLWVRAVDEEGKPVENCNMIKNDKVYFYEYSLLVSVYIKEQCIRIIKISDVSFYRILKIEKSRVDESDSKKGQYGQENQESQDIGGDPDEYYYYTEICSKLEGSYVCELTQVHSSPESYPKVMDQEIQEPEVLRVESTNTNKVVNIEYFFQSDTFVYLYELKNDQKINSSTGINYGLMFIDMGKQTSNESLLECFGLQELIGKLIPKENVVKVEIKKDWLIVQHTQGYVFCLLNHVKIFLFKENHQNQGQNLRNGCIFSLKVQKNTFTKYFVQENILILSQTYLNQTNKSKTITIYSILKEGSIVKKGSYKLVENIEKHDNLETLKEDDEFMGLYRQYIIIINSTTIRKFYLQVNLELVYVFTFNPQFVDRQNSSNLGISNKSNSYPIKYVLFLEKYLIVQFDEFYQLYNIGQQLISIQIAANNFKDYFQGIDPEMRQKFGSLKNNQLPKSVIINDAFLIEGDNIIIYEKDHLVVAKYVTNPTLELGPFEQSQLVVETNLEVRLQPISDVFNFEDVYQQIMFRIIYSHYVVQNIAKNIKTLTVPSVTQNYELQIWTFVFRGPVIEYYLSDNFDGQIVLRQHLTEVSDSMAKLKDKQIPFAIIQYHRPYGGTYLIKTNTSHLLIEAKNAKEKSLLEIPDQLKNTLFLKYLQVNIENGLQFICLSSIDSIVFVKREANQRNVSGKYIIWKVIDHNISISYDIQNPIPRTEIQLMMKPHDEQNSFDLIIRFWNDAQNYVSLQTTYHNDHFHMFQFSLDTEKDELILQESQKVSLNEQILEIKTIDLAKNITNELFVLTYMQNLLILQLSSDENETKFEVKQTISLKDSIPASYRSNKKYVAFEIFSPDVINPDKTLNQPQSNMTMLLFAQTDQAFHIEFEVYLTVNDQNISTYQLNLTNIYASYQNFNFLHVVQIGIASKSTSISNTKPSYLYFVVLCEDEISQTPYLLYFGYNYNYSHSGNVGYFNCGEEISTEDEKFRYIQNGQNFENKTIESPNSKINDLKEYYTYSVDSLGHIQMQILNISLKETTNLTNPNVSYDIQVLYDKTFSVNTTIYMQMNYKRPPKVTYILLNARNFNTRAGIYTKFVFLKDEQTWMGFFITAPIVLVFIAAFGCLLKKYQSKEVLRRKKPKQQPEIIYSDTSRSSDRKEQRVICIEENDSQEESSNNRESLQDQENRSGNVLDQRKISKKSSLLQSPFKSNYGSGYLQDLSESQIDHSEQVKVQFNAHQDKEILAYLISKKGDRKNNRSSFA